MYTKGPWRIFAVLTNIEIITDRRTARETESIATISLSQSRSIELANAQLIAAAPDLLEACKSIRDNWSKNLTEPMAMINAAIAKADGGQ